MQLKTEVNTNAKPNVRNSDVHLDITGDLMTFISIEHASNYKKNNGLHLISCNSGHRCVFFIQGLNGLPNTRFIYSISVRHIL